MKIVACTIVSKNYLPYARVLMDSLAQVHPDWERRVLLVDEMDGCFDPARESFTLTTVDDLDIPNARHIYFKYTILELNTVTKPWFMTKLFQDTGAEAVIYFDPDIRVYSPLNEVVASLASGKLCVLTPHLTAPLPEDGGHPDELDILKSGTYNLGFIAIGNHPDHQELLNWWARKSIDHFASDIAAGLFTDQRWMDLVPSIFGEVDILRHDGYDVAYWNMPQRTLRRDSEGRILVNDSSLVFFHYSGMDPTDLRLFSKHQDRYTRPKAPSVVREIFEDYCALLLEHGYEECRDWPYAFGTMGDGQPISYHLRRLLLCDPEGATILGEDPFAADLTLLNEVVANTTHGICTKIMLQVWRDRADLQVAFPDPVGRDEPALAGWFTSTAAAECHLPASLIDPVRVALNAYHSKATETADAGGAVHPIQSRWLRFLRLLGRPLPRPVKQAVKCTFFPSLVLRYEVQAAANRPDARDRRKNDLIFDAARKEVVIDGFHPQNEWERSKGLAWMGRWAEVSLPLREPIGSLRITGSFAPLKRSTGKQPSLLVAINGSQVGDIPHAADVFDASFSCDQAQDGWVKIELTATDTFVPAGTSQSSDHRELSALVGCIEVNGRVAVDFSRETRTRPPRQVTAEGVNLFGYVTSEMGVGQAARGILVGLEAAEIPHVAVDLSHHANYRSCDDSFCAVCADPRPGWVNYLQVNADMTPRMLEVLPEEVVTAGYVVGSWYWELPEFPDRWLGSFAGLDEIWAPSTFIQQAVAVKSPVPVLRIPPAVQFDIPQRVDRRRFGLQKDRFLFLFMYDMKSHQERKNPEAVIAAYLEAFPDRSRAGLVVKCMNGESAPDAFLGLQKLAESRDDITILDAIMDRMRVYELESACDCFVSLHRSEGFGLGIAEAMYLGKPVIATGWSGNMDFMDRGNSCPVDYRLVPIERDIGPYTKGQIWAEADIEHCAWYMKRLLEDESWAAEIASRGRDIITSDYSGAAVGARIRKRLEYIDRTVLTRSRLGANVQ